MNLAAFKNRLTSTISHLANSNTNTATSRSRIKDTDFAKVVSDQISAKARQQAGNALQAQANSNTNLVLHPLSN